MTRTQNSFFNMITSLGSSLLLLVLNFITRSVFIQSLGTEYLGIEGYFSNILSMLSLAEMGFGGAVIFKLYKPVEVHDRQRILVLMKLLRRAYQIIGLFILGAGLILIPFLPHLVKDYETFDALGLNAVGIFLIYLLGTSSSYWFCAYKSVFMDVNQKSYVLTVVGYFFTLASSICQILSLRLAHSFVLYAVCPYILGRIHSLVNARICNKRYPILKEKTDDHVSREELKSFFKDCSALLLYRLNSTVINASDNIILTAFVGLNATGLYANYLSIKYAIRRLLYSFSNSFRASLGSIYTTGNLEWARLIFRAINFLTVWLYGIAAIGVALLADDFIFLWLGDTTYVVTSWTAGGHTFATPVALLVGIELYLTGQTYYCDICRNTMGLFRQLKYRPIASILINLAVVVATVPYIGIAGCVLSTVISFATTNLIVDPIVIYKYALKQSVWPYFARNLLYIAVTVCAGLLCWWLCGLITVDGLLGFIIHGCICVIVPSAVFCACFFRTQEFHYTKQMAKDLLNKLFHRNSPPAAE